ncbi:unnamed protein product [Symbiodinium sp. CCMP2592]|nr:unnamed protein product [Symbiodinium sp. CCMP2592]
MAGGFGGLIGGEGQNHRPLSSFTYGNRYSKYPAHGYVRGHPGEGMSNPPTYQMCRQIGHDFAAMKSTQYRTSRTQYEHQAFGHAQGASRTTSLPCLHQSAKLGYRPNQTFGETHAKRILASLPPISPW